MIAAAVQEVREELIKMTEKADKLEDMLKQAKEEQEKLEGKLIKKEKREQEGDGNRSEDKDGNGRKSLTNAKDSDVEKLKDGCTRAEFRHWRHCVDMYLEKIPNWRFWSRVLFKIRTATEELGETEVADAIEAVNKEQARRL